MPAGLITLKSDNWGTTILAPQSIQVPIWPTAIDRTLISRPHSGQKKMIGMGLFAATPLV
jgi:hypothetical protein